MKYFRIQLLMAFIVFVCGVSLMGLVYVVFNKPEKVNTPGVVVTSSSPVAAPVYPISPRVNLVSPSLIHHTPYVVPMVGYQETPVAAIPSTRGLYATSSAQVHSVGGGGSGGYGIATTSHSSSSRGIGQSSGTVAMPKTNFVALASSRSMASPEAQDAPQMASVAPRHAPGPPDVTPTEDHQLIEHPVGDALWPLLLLALGYVAVIRIGRSRRQGS